MTGNRIFWVMMAVVVWLAVGSSLAEYAGSLTKSVLVASSVGVVLSLVTGFALRPFQKRAEVAGYFEPSEGGRISKLIAVTMMVAVAGLAMYQISHTGADEFGNVNYSKAAVGGFWIGTVMFGIWNIFKTRQPDVSQ